MDMTLEAACRIYMMPSEYDPEELSALAREHASEAASLRCRQFKLFEKLHLDAGDLRTADRLSHEIVGRNIEEAEMLRMLNLFFLAGGSVVGNEHVVKGHTYRLVTPGNPCVYLGAEVPDDEVESDREALAERQFEYTQMVHVA
jgi:hypothetical protein